MSRPLRPTAQIARDTTPEAHAVQTEALRRLGGPGRSALMFELNHFVRRLSEAGIRSRHAAYSDDEVRFALFRLLLGDELTLEVWPDRDLVDP